MTAFLTDDLADLDLLAAVRGTVRFTEDRDGAGDALTGIAGFNTAKEHRPDVVVNAADARDVQLAVRYAAEHDLTIGVLATGHSAPTVTGGMLVVTSALKDISVDAAARTATVGGGAKWSDVLPVVAPHGLAPIVGSSSDVGVVGYHLGGGLSPLGRALGWAADSVESFDVVTADGELRHVDAEHDADLFWALRGGRAGFGIVTAITFRLHAVSRFYGGALLFAADDAAAVLHTWRAVADADDLPEEFSTSVAILRLPPLPTLPPMLAGKTVVAVRVTSLGAPSAAERLLAPLRAAATPLIDTVADRPITELDLVHTDPVEPMPSADAGELLAALPADAIDALLAAAGPQVEMPVVMVELRRLGGALTREPAGGNAVGHRDARYTYFAVAPYPQPLRTVVRGVLAGVMAALAPWQTGGMQANLSQPRDRADWARVWSPAQAARLSEIRRAYDPSDRFAPIGGVSI